MKVIGIDGCKSGWFAVVAKDNGNFDCYVYTSISDVWDKHKDSDHVLIDIPIGLIEDSFIERACDSQARRILGPGRGSSVFVTPSRQAVYADSYEEACNVNRIHTGRSLAKQSWSIAPKIREVDIFMQTHTEAKNIVKESHPEIGFWALNGKTAMKYNKKSEEGTNERIDLLVSIGEQDIMNIYYKSLSCWTRSELAKDDILDAMCLMVNGVIGFRSRLDSIPANPQIDNVKLPMQMVYGKV